MSLTTDELNYIVWRYLQESGLETTAFALQDESSVHELDDRLKDFVPIGSLVNLVQKGILYSEVDSLVESNGNVNEDKFYRENFTLLQALGADAAINQPIESTGRFSREGDEVDAAAAEKMQEEKPEDSKLTAADREESPGFIKVLPQVFSFGPSTVADWNPTAPSVLAYGLTDARGRIAVIVNEGKSSEQIKIDHAQEFNSFTNDYSSDLTMVSWSRLGNYVISGVQYGELRLWAADGTLKSALEFHNAPVLLIRWSPNSTHCITMDAENYIAVWDIQTQQIIQSFNFAKNESTPGSITPGLNPALSNNIIDHSLLGLDAEWIDDSRFIIPGLNSTAILFSITDRNPQGTLKGHSKPITVIKFHVDSQSLMTASDDQTIRIWNGSNFNNSQILIGHSQSIVYATWINRDFVLSSSLDGSLRIWDIRNGKTVFTYVMEGLPVIVADLSHDQNHLAVGTSDGTITVLRLDLLIDVKLKPVGEFQSSIQPSDSNSYITSLKWNSESKLLVVGYSHSESVVIRLE
jgi:transducin (beta)-like 1